MMRFNNLTYNISQPADTFLQAVVMAERNLAVIAVSLPTFTVHDKILNGLLSIYSPITALLQNESPQCDVTSMINVINNWEIRIQGVLGLKTQLPLQLATVPSACTSLTFASTSGSTPPYDWTNTKGRTDVCYQCGLPGHFAQYCISEMPDDVRRRIVRDRKEKANIAADSDSDSDAKHAHFATTDHFAAAALDLPSELNLDTMDHETSIGFVNSHPNAVHIPPISVADFEAGCTDELHATLLAHVQAQSSSSSSATSTATPTVLSATPTPAPTPPSKKKKKGPASLQSSPPVHSVQSAMHGLTLSEEEAEYSM
ncbi:hypothetical protein DFH08DRAFT_960587 [Mycena albidolilacea]|uniref:CCHC-type domain-containing protein n=1 Tax=Mycena albidolilacea TaxID=1033008 RepID=A0AAD7A0Q8_9AGAR|nr:hypothetical protein DFH08DRAFT_960587 [Mycena albidolilacea]